MRVALTNSSRPTPVYPTRFTGSCRPVSEFARFMSADLRVSMRSTGIPPAIGPRRAFMRVGHGDLEQVAGQLRLTESEPRRALTGKTPG